MSQQESPKRSVKFLDNNGNICSKSVGRRTSHVTELKALSVMTNNNDIKGPLSMSRSKIFTSPSAVTKVTIHDCSSNSSFSSFEDENCTIDLSFEGMTLHARECVSQMKNSCDKLLHAKQMIEKDTVITSEEREKLLRSVFKAINQFRQRLENSLPEDRSFSDLTTNNGSDSLGHMSNISISTPSHPTTSPVVNEDFIKKHGPQLMKLLQENMARNN